MKEIWRDINGYKGLYQVSNLGRVWSCRQKRLRKLQKNTHGYMSLFLYKNKKGTAKQVHRLVAEAFIPNPKKLEQVNHKNGDKTDNRVENLEWVTRYENSIHAVYTLNHIGQYKCKRVRCKETGIIYRSLHEASRETGCPVMCISDIANRRVKKNGKHLYHIHGLSWEFV